jgi:hypothetical protein
MNDIRLFTSQPKAKFYDKLFFHLDLSCIPDKQAHTGRKGYSKHALICAFIVMKCEGFSQITDLLDYLNNNLIIAYYCGFDITKPLPSYWVFERFIKNFDNNDLKQLMQFEVLKLYELGIIDTSFIGLDSTSVLANTKNNNSKSFATNKFHKSNQPKSDKDCALGVHTASNNASEKNFEYYWGYKNHVLVDCITGLPIFEMTTTANVFDSKVALDVLSQTNRFLSISGCFFLADKAYDNKEIHNTIKNVYNGDCFIPLNTRNTKNPKKLPIGNPFCDAGLAMNKDGKNRTDGRLRQKFCCPFKNSKDDNACPCNHLRYQNGKKSRGCTKYITIPDDYRLSIDRNSIEFKSVYALRTETERYNSRFKSTGQDRLWIRNGNSAQNLNSMAHISLLAIALTAVITKNECSYRSIKSIKRVA